MSNGIHKLEQGTGRYISVLDRILITVCFGFSILFLLALTGCAAKPTFKQQHGGRGYSEYHGAPSDFRGSY